MATWVNNVHSRAGVLQQQIALALRAQTEQGVDMSAFVATYQGLLAELYTDSLPLAQLMDRSDLLFHAEGPGAQHHAAFSHAVAWLCEEVERRIKQLATASLKIVGPAADAAEHDLRVLLNGMAPGSLWAGFSVDSARRMAGHPELPLMDVAPAMATVRAAVRSLPIVARYIGDERVSTELMEAIPDPQVRDSSLMAAFHLSPTGRRGIHTLEISAPGSSDPQSALTNRERTVLRETAVKQPMMRRALQGSFVGQLREVDLDTRRFQLRGVPGVGTLRCVLEGLSLDTARRHLGQGAKVTGTYEADAEGRPRMMRVEQLEPFQIQAELEA